MSFTADGAGKFALCRNGSRISLRDSGMTDLWGFGSIFCTFRERFHGHPHPAVIPAKERSDASRDSFRDADGWERVRTHALRRNGSQISLRDSGMTALGEMRGAGRGVAELYDGDRAGEGGGGAGVFGEGVQENFGFSHREFLSLKWKAYRGPLIPVYSQRKLAAAFTSPPRYLSFSG
jgi:hypothetical protein